MTELLQIIALPEVWLGITIIAYGAWMLTRPIGEDKPEYDDATDF